MLSLFIKKCQEKTYGCWEGEKMEKVISDVTFRVGSKKAKRSWGLFCRRHVRIKGKRQV